MILFPFFELYWFEAEGRGCCQRQQQRGVVKGMQIVKPPILYGV
jgi:hypothetical protein